MTETLPFPDFIASLTKRIWDETPWGLIATSGFSPREYDLRISFSQLAHHLPGNYTVFNPVYLDIYGAKTEPRQLTFDQHARLCLSRSFFYEYLSDLQKLKESGGAPPDYIFEIAAAVAERAPFPAQTARDDTSSRMLGLLLVFDTIKSKKLELTGKQSEALTKAIGPLIDALRPIFPAIAGLEDFLNTSYRNLGYFELDPFSKKITSDKLKQMREKQKDKTQPLDALYTINIGSIYKDIFGPKLRALSGEQNTILYTLLYAHVPMNEKDLIQMMSVPESDLSKFRQAMAELIDKGALAEKDGDYSVRGEEFIDWMEHTSIRRPRGVPMPLRAKPAERNYD